MITYHAIISRLKYLLLARHRKGHNIHSPYTFQFINNVLFETKPYYCYKILEEFRTKLSTDNTIIITPSIGTQKEEKKRKIKHILQHTSKPTKHSQLLHRICVDLNAKTILELGTSLGISTLYLASCDKTNARVYTFEGSKPIIKIAQANFNSMKYNNIKLITGNINDTLCDTINDIETIDLVFFDANHAFKATINYFNTCKTKIHNDTIFIFDDIHKNKEMEKAWKEIKESEDTSTTIDIYHMGIVWFNKHLPKKNFIISY